MRTIQPADYRDYQILGRDKAFETFEGGTESALVVMPTGTGKTVLAGMCVERAAEQNRKVLFLAHREILINQAYRTISRFGLDCSVEMGNKDARKHAATLGPVDCVVGSVQTLQDDRLMRWDANEFGLIIIDECHRALTDSYTKILNWFGHYNLLGITATPRRGDNRNLGSRFKTKAYEYKLRDAIQDGWIVPIRTRTCKVSIDLRGILAQGDYNAGDLAERIGPKIEQLARALLKEAGDRPFVAFLPDVGSAMAFADVCDQLGTPTVYVAGDGGNFGMPKKEQEACLHEFNVGRVQGVACCDLLVEGWDCPHVEVVGILRATKQWHRYMQMVGRGTRPCPESGKTECLVLDFDWKTDSDAKDLCSSVDLFDDGELDEDVYAEAKLIAAERSQQEEDVDIQEVLDEAERIVQARRKFLVKLTGQKPEYLTMDYDPVGVGKMLGIKLNRKYDFDKRGDNPASAAQLGKLRSLGIEMPDGLSKWGASKMIDKLMKRRERGDATPSQVGAMLAYGVNPMMAKDMSFDNASEAIAALQPKKQRSFLA